MLGSTSAAAPMQRRRWFLPRFDRGGVRTFQADSFTASAANIRKAGILWLCFARVPLLAGVEFGKESPVSVPISAGAAVFGVLASSAARFVR